MLTFVKFIFKYLIYLYGKLFTLTLMALSNTNFIPNVVETITILSINFVPNQFYFNHKYFEIQSVDTTPKRNMLP